MFTISVFFCLLYEINLMRELFLNTTMAAATNDVAVLSKSKSNMEAAKIIKFFVMGVVFMVFEGV